MNEEGNVMRNIINEKPDNEKTYNIINGNRHRKILIYTNFIFKL